MRMALPGFTALALLHDPLSAATPPNHLEEVILVYKSHFDIGYTHLASETIHNYRTSTIDRRLAVVEKNKNLPLTSSLSGPFRAGR